MLSNPLVQANRTLGHAPWGQTLGTHERRVENGPRKWVLSGAFGRKTEKRWARALAAAERIDTAAAVSQWETLKRRNDRSAEQARAPARFGDEAQ